MKRIGVIDIGSNSIKLDIFLIKDNGSIIKKNKHRSISSLEGNYLKGEIRHDFIKKTLKTVKTFVDLCKLTGVDNIVAFATESIRKARNKNEIIKGIYDLCHINIRVISGKEEAFYSYKGVKDDVDISSGIVMDIGGGSTEILYFKNQKVMESISFPFGARTISKKFDLKDCVPENLEEELMRYLACDFFSKISWLSEKSNIVLVGSGGTMKNVAKLINHNLYPCLREDNNYHFTRENVKETHLLIKNKSINDINNLKGVADRRVEVIKGGIEILVSFLIATNIHSIIVSKKGIREGFLKEYLEKTIN